MGYDGSQRDNLKVRREINWRLWLSLLAIVVVLFCVVFIPYACVGATAVVPMDKHALVYQGGPLDGRNFERQLPPGVGRFWKGNLQSVYFYPSTERTYIISEIPNEGDVKEADRIEAKTKDGNAIRIQVATTFHLVPENLQSFHERLGLKYGAWSDEGWDALLHERVRQPIKMAFQEEAKKYTVIEAISDKGMIAMASAVGDVIQREIDNYMGGHYIDVGTLSLIDINADPAVQTQIENVAATQQQILAAENRYKAAQIDAQANEVLRKSLQGEGGMTAVLQKAVESGRITFWVLPSDMQITAPTITSATPVTPSR